MVYFKFKKEVNVINFRKLYLNKLNHIVIHKRHKYQQIKVMMNYSTYLIYSGCCLNQQINRIKKKTKVLVICTIYTSCKIRILVFHVQRAEVYLYRLLCATTLLLFKKKDFDL